MDMARRGVGVGLAALLAGPSAGRIPSALATEAYPSRPVSLVVPFAPGGSASLVARALGHRLTAALGQPFVVTNAPGRGGLHGTCDAGVQPADGQALLLATNGVFAIAAQANPCVTPFEDAFTPVALLASTPRVLCVAASAPWHDLAGLMEAARLAPGTIRYAAVIEPDLPLHLVADAFEVTLVATTASGPAAGLESLGRGQAEVMVADLPAALPALRTGEVRALAVTSATRARLLPAVPTVAESGVPGFDAATAFVLFARRGTPPAILQRLSAATIAALQGEALRQVLEPLGIGLQAGTPEEAAAYVAAETRKWRRAMRELGIQPGQ